MKCTLKLTITALLFTGLPFLSICFAEGQSADSLSANHKLASYSQTTAQEMRQKLQTCSQGSYFGPIAPEKDVSYQNCEGKTLVGRIDASGRGRLVDEEGNLVLVMPTQGDN